MRKPVTTPFVEAIENAAVLDGPAKPLAKKVRGLGSPELKELMSGTWIGHAVHPLMAQTVLGAFLSATLLDVLGGDDDGAAAERLIAVGIAAYGPTAATGLSDWADSEPGNDGVRRTGVVHAVTNGTALACYAASLVARRRGNRGRGKLLGFGGMAALSVGGYLGGHMAYTQGVGVNQTVFDEGPGDWTDAGPASDLVPGEPKRVVVDETPVMLLRHGDGIHALHDRCAHRGCSLTDHGEVDGESIVCKCHGSKFALADGGLERGPATTTQPSYEVREREGTIELRFVGGS